MYFQFHNNFKGQRNSRQSERQRSPVRFRGSVPSCTLSPSAINAGNEEFSSQNFQQKFKSFEGETILINLLISLFVNPKIKKKLINKSAIKAKNWNLIPTTLIACQEFR